MQVPYFFLVPLLLDYGVPEEHKAANVDWDKADSDPISDIMAWYNKLGTKPTRIITSNTVLAKMTRHQNIVAALYLLIQFPFSLIRFLQ